MQYSQKFKDRARRLIDSEEFYNHLENGDECVGKYLLEGFQGKTIPPEEYIKAIESRYKDNFDELYNKSKIIVEFKSLYREWEKIYNEEKQI